MATAVTTGPGAPARREAAGGTKAVFEVLRAWGVDRVFICPGSTEAAFLDASSCHPDVRLVPTAHESVAVAMADAYARVSGRVAVAYVHTHLGLANGLAHLACAQLEHSPVVVICGLKATALQGAGGFTTTSDVRALSRGLTKWEWQSLRAEAIGEDLTRALRIASAAPTGPTCLAIPQDLLEGTGPVVVPDPAAFRVDARSRPDPELARAAAQLLQKARRPLVVAGAEVGRTGAWAELLALAERLGAPVLGEERRTIEAAPAPTELRSYAGLLDAGLEAVKRADVILLAGGRAPTRFEATTPPALPLGTPLIHLAADAEEVGSVHPAAIALVADARLALRDLVALLTEIGTGPSAEAIAFRDRARAAHRAGVSRARAQAARDEDRVPIRVGSLMRRLTAAIEPGTVIVDDSVTSKAALLTHALVYDGRCEYLTTGGGSLGWGMGGALGAALARPARPVVAVVGDGVFQFGVQALWTAVRERIPVTFVVVNNQRYAAVTAALVRFGGDAAARTAFPATDLSGPGLAAIASAYGALGRRVERLVELEGALEAARAHAGPAVVEVMTDPEDVGPLR